MMISDPVMLLSYVNTQLRDNYSSLDALVDALDLDKEELVRKLAEVGYIYNAERNRFC